MPPVFIVHAVELRVRRLDPGVNKTAVFDQPEEEGELTTNQRFEKLCRLEQLGIYVDEAHHAFGKALAKDMGVGAKETHTSLRTTIDILAASLNTAGTRVVACYNYTGTPYVGREVLPEVVYAYGLKEAIDKVVAAAKKYGIALGRPAGSAEQVQQYMKEGFLFFQASSELGAGSRFFFTLPATNQPQEQPAF